MEKQIPFGDDSKKSNSKSKYNSKKSKCNSNCKSRSFAALRMTVLWRSESLGGLDRM